MSHLLKTDRYENGRNPILPWKECTEGGHIRGDL